MNRHASVTLGLIIAGLSASALLAGPITPPAGTVTPSYKTLGEVEPRTAINATNTPGDATTTYLITQPGSYYLTGNIAGTAGKAVITIATTDRVTIDLCGFSVTGGTYGVTTPLGQDGLTVRNGTISSQSGGAVYLPGCDHARLESLTVLEGTGPTCITVGQFSIVRDCHVQGGANGILTSDSCIVQGCTVSGPSQQGFQGGNNCEVSNCIADTCGSDGFKFTGAESTFSHCTARHCTSHGFEVGLNNLIENCVTSYDNGSGFLLGPQCTIRDSVADNCSAQGIVIQGGGTVLNNQCKANGNGTAAGIWIQGTTSLVEGNHCIANGYGIYVSGIDNVIIGNRCGANTQNNYFIMANNSYGPVVSPAYNASTVSGSSIPSNLGTTDPNTNFAF